MAKIDLKTLLTKLTNVFPKDVYLVNNWCAIAGPESDIENRGQFICIFNTDVREMMTKMFPNSPVLYINPIREAKGDLEKINEIINTNDINKVNDRVQMYMDNFQKYTSWESFNFTDEDINSIFTNGDSLTLFEHEDSRSSVIVSKSLFPLVTAKTMGSVVYRYDRYLSNETLDQMTIVYDYGIFQLVMRYIFLKI